MKKAVRYIPMILFVLTILSFIFMIIVRLNAMGTRLLSISSGLGRLIASQYNPSVILFLILLAALIAAVLITNKVKRHEHSVHAEDNATNE